MAFHGTPPVSIEDIGLEKHLNDTAEKHNSYGYNDFIKMITQDKPLGKAALAKMFKVDRNTIYKWLEVYKKELEALKNE